MLDVTQSCLDVDTEFGVVSLTDIFINFYFKNDL